MRFLLSVLVGCRLLVVATLAATLAGQPVQGGATVETRFPVAKSFQDVAAQMIFMFRRSALQQRAHPGEQLRRREWLYQIIVRPGHRPLK
jgi:hypothetical protein